MFSGNTKEWKGMNYEKAICISDKCFGHYGRKWNALPGIWKWKIIKLRKTIKHMHWFKANKMERRYMQNMPPFFVTTPNYLPFRSSPLSRLQNSFILWNRYFHSMKPVISFNETGDFNKWNRFAPPKKHCRDNFWRFLYLSVPLERIRCFYSATDFLQFRFTLFSVK